MPLTDTHSSEELICYIEAAGESNNIDAKGPMAWDGGEASAGLTKDIIAFANSRDGGVIVIGKEEPEPGKFVLKGVTPEQAATFETTKVATWVNNHCSPPVNVICYRQEFQANPFIVIAVAEFHDVPVLCTKQFDLPGKPPKTLLRKGALYVRTANAESAPLSSLEDLRTLIGIATTKRTDQMLSMFQTMLKGQPLLALPHAEDLFNGERDEVQAALERELNDQPQLGAWNFVWHPASYRPDRWEETEKLKKLVEKSSVRIRQKFPPISYGLHVREWGICSQEYDEAFGMTRSGLFVCLRLFRENTTVFRNPSQPYPDIAPGQWLDFKLNLFKVIEFFMFLSRLVEEMEGGEELFYEVAAGPLTGRRLASMDGNLHLDPSEPCRAGVYRGAKTIPIETLRASWEDECAKALHGFFELFGGHRISTDTLRKWVEKFRQRRIS